MLTDGWVLGPVDADHAQLPDLPSPAKVEHGQGNNSNLLIGTGGTPTDKAGGILAGTDLGFEFY